MAAASTALPLVLSLALPYLDVRDLLAVAQTCKSSYSAAKEDFLWQDLFRRWYGAHDFRSAADPTLSWLQKFKQSTNAMSFSSPAWYQITAAFPKQPIDSLPRFVYLYGVDVELGVKVGYV